VTGIFDSGVGGLTVYQELKRRQPLARAIYYGDTAHVPYGSRPAEELIGFADAIVAFLIKEGAEVILDACNSTSAVALDFLQAKYSVPIIGVIEPGARAAVRISKNKRIGLLATEATINSQAHQKAIARIDPEAKVFGQACPLFVPLVERGLVEGPQALAAAMEYLAPIQEQQADTVILGCTHYPYLKKVIRKVLGEAVQLVDPAGATVEEVLTLLTLKEGPLPPDKFWVSGDTQSFAATAKKLLGDQAYLLGEVRRADNSISRPRRGESAG